jgi:hypothetical protein
MGSTPIGHPIPPASPSAPTLSRHTAIGAAAERKGSVEGGRDGVMADESPSTAGPGVATQSPAMGPTIRPFAYRRDPWWDPEGRTARRRRRRNLLAWSVLVSLAVTLGAIAGELRVAIGS